MFTFEYSISEDRSELSVDLPSKKLTMTAAELEEFMRGLAVARAAMQPEMPNESMTATSLFSSVPCNRWQVTLDPDAPTQIRLFLQHLGFGWVWIPLSERNVSEMQDVMQHTLELRPKLS